LGPPAQQLGETRGARAVEARWRPNVAGGEALLGKRLAIG
jgi:hypothetical protein